MLTAPVYLQNTRTILENVPWDAVQAVTQLLQRAHDEGRTLFVCGNGGSASTASHFALDLSKQGIARPDARHPRVLALTDNQAALTAWANDTDYSYIFEAQLTVWLQPSDVVICISGSGNSPNVLRAADYANAQGATTVALTGRDGGKLAPLCHKAVIVPDQDMGQIETVHLALCHYWVHAFQFRDEA